jgi:xanthine/uracil/vitamin C permease (AzgA family)
MVGGFVLSLILCENSVTIAMFQAEAIRLPTTSIPFFSLPPNLLQLLIAVIPVTFVVFTENISRVTVITRMTSENSKEAIFSDENVKKFRKATLSHGIASVIASLMGSVPNTLYAENIAVMGTQSLDKTGDKKFKDVKDEFIKNLHKSFSCAPYFVAAVLAIVVSFSGHLQQLLMNIPTPVLGGMKLFLFGIIAAPGIQLLVEQRVDYKKISNQILTASVLIAGISGLTVSLGIVELKGMSLGIIVGIFVNLSIRTFDYVGRLNDSIKIEEVFEVCVKEIPQNMQLLTVDQKNYSACIEDIQALLSGKKSVISINDVSLSAETLFSTISDSSKVTFGFDKNAPIVQIRQINCTNYIWISKSNLPEDDYDKFIRDYSNENDNAVEEIDDVVHIRMGANVPMRIIRKLLKLI